MSDLQPRPRATEIKHVYARRRYSRPPISNVYVRRRRGQSKSIGLPVANSSSLSQEVLLPIDSSNNGSSSYDSPQNKNRDLEEIVVPMMSDGASENNPSWAAAVQDHMPKPKTYTQLIQFFEYLAALNKQAKKLMNPAS